MPIWFQVTRIRLSHNLEVNPSIAFSLPHHVIFLKTVLLCKSQHTFCKKTLVKREFQTPSNIGSTLSKLGNLVIQSFVDLFDFSIRKRELRNLTSKRTSPFFKVVLLNCRTQLQPFLWRNWIYQFSTMPILYQIWIHFFRVCMFIQ